jgi:hypothetical protein
MSFNTHVGVDPYHRFTEDPCESRHGGNIDSRAAWERVGLCRRQTYNKILAFYHASPNPISPKEICEVMGIQLNVISGRFTELKEMGILHPIDDTFNGSRRLELVSRVTPGSLAELVELATPASEQFRKLPGHDKCVALFCTTDALPETLKEGVESRTSTRVC